MVGVVGRRRLTLRGRLIIVGVAIVLLTAGVLLWANGVFDKKTDTAVKPAQNAASATTDAYKYAYGGDYSKAQQMASEQATSATNNDDKAFAYMTQASIALNAKKYDEAKQYAEKAEAAAPSDVTASLLGDIAMAQGDKATAAKDYQLALDRVDKSVKTNRQRIQSYQTKLKAAQQ